MAFEDVVARVLTRIRSRLTAEDSRLYRQNHRGRVFPRNTWPNFAQYTSERPEMSSHGEKSGKAKTTKQN
ncbi:MAG: hypothetical protein DMF28_09165 [Verrucomicrobia bacterium]|nr:MAG: hypothetical protein DMF28_09165 [Verrucomicrobiota bacterium]